MQNHSLIGTNLLNINLEIQSHIWYHHHIITIIINITHLVLWFRCLRQLRRSLQEYFLKTKSEIRFGGGVAHFQYDLTRGINLWDLPTQKLFLPVICLFSIGFSDGHWFPCLLVVGCSHNSLLFAARWVRGKRWCYVVRGQPPSFQGGENARKATSLSYACDVDQKRPSR